jgi:hypothetical protein
MAKLFLNGIEDPALKSNLQSHDPKNLPEAYNLAEEARIVLCEIVATSQAIGLSLTHRL